VKMDNEMNITTLFKFENQEFANTRM
jgi:hypothetical protein